MASDYPFLFSTKSLLSSLSSPAARSPTREKKVLLTTLTEFRQSFARAGNRPFIVRSITWGILLCTLAAVLLLVPYVITADDTFLSERPITIADAKVGVVAVESAGPKPVSYRTPETVLQVATGKNPEGLMSAGLPCPAPDKELPLLSPQQVITEWISALNNRDSETLRSLYGNNVRYYEVGIVPNEEVQLRLKKDMLQWSGRELRQRGTIKTRTTNDPAIQIVEVRFASFLVGKKTRPVTTLSRKFALKKSSRGLVIVGENKLQNA